MKFYAPGLIEDDEGEYVTRDDAEQAERARTLAVNEKRKADAMVIQVREEYEQAANDAVAMANLAQQAIYELYDGRAAHTRDLSYKEAQAIKERYEGGKDNGRR